MKDPVLGSLTALECAIDGLHKLSQMAEEVFGGDIFSSGKQKQKQRENEPGGRISTLNFINVHSPILT